MVTVKGEIMKLNRKIELEREETNEINAILILGQERNQSGEDTILLDWITRKLQEAFDFGYNEGRKSNE